MVENYYKALNDKNISIIEHILHPQVTLLSPLVEVRGKEAILESVKQFVNFLESVTVGVKFNTNNQVMVAYDVKSLMLTGNLRIASPKYTAFST